MQNILALFKTLLTPFPPFICKFFLYFFQLNVSKAKNEGFI